MFETYTPHNNESLSSGTVSHDTEHHPWLESSSDGLLTLDAERFLLSLPFDYVPGNTALIMPELINRMAQSWKESTTPVQLIQWMDTLENKPHHMDSASISMVNMELQALRDWLNTNQDACHLFESRLEVFGD